MKNTITTTSQATANFLAAADDIMDLMDNLGFTSEIQNDPEMIRQTVAQIIRQNIEGNTTYTSYDLGGGIECRCCDGEPVSSPRRFDDDGPDYGRQPGE